MTFGCRSDRPARNTILRERTATDDRLSKRAPSRAAIANRAGAAALLFASLTLGGCATQYDLTLRPRDGGPPAVGMASELGPGQARLSIEIGDKTYRGTWTQVAPERSTTYVGASSWGWWDWGPNSASARASGETVAKALLQALDGSAMRCDFFGPTLDHGTGTCVDDKGQIFDVQFRSRNSK
jgi:hypothetical protein